MIPIIPVMIVRTIDDEESASKQAINTQTVTLNHIPQVILLSQPKYLDIYIAKKQKPI